VLCAWTRLNVRTLAGVTRQRAMHVAVQGGLLQLYVRHPATPLDVLCCSTTAHLTCHWVTAARNTCHACLHMNQLFQVYLHSPITRLLVLWHCLIDQCELGACWSGCYCWGLRTCSICNGGMRKLMWSSDTNCSICTLKGGALLRVDSAGACHFPTLLMPIAYYN
jgi:hypothetical protein